MAKTEAAAETKTATAAAAAAELMSQLRLLVRAIAEEGDGRIETYKDAARALESLTAIQFVPQNGGANSNSNSNPNPDAKRPSPLSLQKQSRIEPVEFPREYLCPISAEIMRDPVVLAATGETYDRAFIEEWLNSGKRSCPRSKQVLSDLTLVPNNALRRMISQWCADHDISLPSFADDNPDGSSPITRSDRTKLNSLLASISTASPEEKKQAVRELRLLTKLHPSHRAVLGETPDAIPKLLAVAAELLDAREDVATTIMNLSIHDSNKKSIGESPGVVEFLISSLEAGTMETRGNSAAALFTLSALDSNKKRIGEAGAMGPLVGLIESGGEGARRDAASAMFNLCLWHENRGRAVEEGGVEVLLRCVEKGTMVDESLSVLAMLSGSQEAVEDIGEKGGLEIMMRVIRGSGCAKNKENAVVVLFSMCMSDRAMMREVREEEMLNGTLSRLAETGTSRARRKAAGILDRLRRTALSSHNSC